MRIVRIVRFVRGGKTRSAAEKVEAVSGARSSSVNLLTIRVGLGRSGGG
ncbi:MAG: hypothetical protein K2Y04_10845 [Caulobacteraceae bacterium]|nr:hypothetical protein [Caulobacteraceae bacterium]